MTIKLKEREYEIIVSTYLLQIIQVVILMSYRVNAL